MVKAEKQRTRTSGGGGIEHRAWTATSGLAAALGPVVGGLLVTASWRWVFLINVPVGILARCGPGCLPARLVGHRRPVVRQRRPPRWPCYRGPGRRTAAPLI